MFFVVAVLGSLASIAVASLDDSLPALRTFTFTPSQDRVLAGSDATACTHCVSACTNVPASAILGDLALLTLKNAQTNYCFVDGRYNHQDYKIEHGTMTSSDGESFPAYKVHPPTRKASLFVGSQTEVYTRTAEASVLTVFKFNGHDFSSLSTLSTSAGVFQGTGVRADSLTSPVLLVFGKPSDRLSGWTNVSPTVEGARLASADGFHISARRFQVGGDPFVPEEDWIDGPDAHSANYGIPKKFFAVGRRDGREGVVWQDQTSRSVYMTWFASDLNSADTTAIFRGRDHLVSAVSDKSDAIILMMVSESTPASKSGTTAASAMKVNSFSGAVVLNNNLDTSSSGLNIHSFFSSGASMAWNTQTNKVGLCISRIMTVSRDGLNHQGAIAVVLDASTLEVVANHGQTSGHSFANSLQLASDGTFLGMDLGDNYPRGIHVWRFSDAPRGLQESFNVYTFKTQHATSSGGRPIYREISNDQTTYYKWSNDNKVYTEIAHQGLVEVGDGILVFFAGEQPPLDNAKVGSIMNAPRNLGFVKIGKNLARKSVLSSGAKETGGFYNFGGGWTPQENNGVNFLTTSSSIDESVSRPKTARLGENHNLLMWEVWSRTTYVESQLMVVTDDGAVAQTAITSTYPVRLPIADDLHVQNGRAVAYAGTSSRQLVRYEVCAGASCSPTGTTSSADTSSSSVMSTARTTTTAETTSVGTTTAETTSTTTSLGCDDNCEDLIFSSFCRYAERAWSICSMDWWNDVVCKATCNRCGSGLPSCSQALLQVTGPEMLNDTQVLSALRDVNRSFRFPSDMPDKWTSSTLGPSTTATATGSTLGPSMTATTTDELTIMGLSVVSGAHTIWLHRFPLILVAISVVSTTIKLR